MNKAKIEQIKLEVASLHDGELEDMYCDFLDEVYPNLEIAGMRGYLTSNVLRKVDPTAFRCGFADWLDAECQNDVLVEIDGQYYRQSDIDDLPELEEEEG